MTTSTKKSVIYEPTGAAAEYCQRALNLFNGCVHGCKYCYVPLVRHVDRVKFHTGALPRVTRDEIERSAAASKGDKRPVLMCFTSDPYQKAEMLYLNLTRAAILRLHKYDHPFTVLTKGGQLAQRDFDLYRPEDSFGVTMTFLDEKKSLEWEPGAALPETRMNNLMQAKACGISTWISLEPVIDANETLAIIHATAGFTDHYKVGKLNYCGQTNLIDNRKLVQDVIDTALIKYGRGIHIKNSLSMCFGSPGGYRIGEQLP